MRKIISIIILVAFISTSVQLTTYAQLSSVDPMPHMPAPGTMVHLSPAFTPAYLKGIVIHPENALKFDFIIYKGDRPLADTEKRVEYTKLAKYFLASLAIPDDNQWVNLSPYEKDRIIKDDFGKTEMGRDLLAQDYMLKQLMASLIYPQDSLGRKFWDRVYTQAQQQYGTTNIPMNTFNKVWIVPDQALVYEKGNTAYVLKSHLRVMMEEDYLSLEKHSGITSTPVSSVNALGSKIVKQIILPELQREVNEGENFAPLRQVYSGMILAAWYKRALKESLLSRIYADKAKVKGIDQDPKTNEEIYRQYLKAYKKGVFNFIKEDMNKYTNEMIPRKYFSGGCAGPNTHDPFLPHGVETTDRLTAGEDAAILSYEGGDDLATVETNEVPFESLSIRESINTLFEYMKFPESSGGRVVFKFSQFSSIAVRRLFNIKDPRLEALAKDEFVTLLELSGATAIKLASDGGSLSFQTHLTQDALRTNLERQFDSSIGTEHLEGEFEELAAEVEGALVVALKGKRTITAEGNVCAVALSDNKVFREALARYLALEVPVSASSQMSGEDALRIQRQERLAMEEDALKSLLSNMMGAEVTITSDPLVTNRLSFTVRLSRKTVESRIDTAMRVIRRVALPEARTYQVELRASVVGTDGVGLNDSYVSQAQEALILALRSKFVSGDGWRQSLKELVYTTAVQTLVGNDAERVLGTDTKVTAARERLLEHQQRAIIEYVDQMPDELDQIEPVAAQMVTQPLDYSVSLRTFDRDDPKEIIMGLLRNEA